jgi:tetratricopeptide (TPR) repeat protein
MTGLHRVVAAVLFALLTPTAAALAAPADIRAAQHQGFARIAIDFHAAVPYDVHVADGTLRVHFARPLGAKVDRLRSELAAYIADVRLATNGTTLVARLRRPVTVHAFTVRNTVIVLDLTPQATPRPAPAATAATSHPGVAMRLQVAKDGDTTRVTFAWRQAVRYEFTRKGSVVHLTFRGGGVLDESALAAALPALAPTIARRDGLTKVTMTVPKGAHFKHLRRGKVMVIELTAAPAPAPAPAPKPAPVTAAKDATAPETAIERIAAPAAADTAVTPAPASTPPPAPVPAAAATPAPPPVAATAVPPQPDTPVAAPQRVAVQFATDDQGASLTFAWPVATTAALFRHAGSVWVVFALPTMLDLADPLAHGQARFSTVTQVPARGATALRIVPLNGLAPSLRRVGTEWVIDFKPQPATVEAPIVFDAHPGDMPPDAVFRVHDASAPVRLDLPALGGPLEVVPVGELGRGIASPPALVDFAVLPSLQGIVIRAHSDDLAFRVEPDGVTVTRPGGLILSSERDRMLGQVPKRAHELFDFAAWRGPASRGFAAERSVLEHAIAAAPQNALSPPRLALAHFYFAHLFGAETTAVLEAIDRDDPQTGGQPAVRALMGAACLLARSLACAATELGLKSLDGEPEVALWRGALASENRDWTQAAADFLNGVSLLPTYPPALRARFGLDAAQAMIETQDARLALPLLDLVLSAHPARRDLAMALYLEGLIAQRDGHLDNAIGDWDKAAALDDPPSRARALYARANALYGAKRATLAATIKSLDDLRFAWRGGPFEFHLLRRLGELKLKADDAAGGLAAMQQAVTYFPNEPAAKDIAKESSDAFANLFLGPHAGDLPPLDWLVLYDRFHDLEPAGPRRDLIVHKLIDRLVAVDLLDRAAGLLEEQVKTRLSGDAKVRGATQLALLRLLDHKPDAALAALDIDVGSDVPPALARQRQQLRARVLMEMGRAQDALALLADDNSRDADRLRADIYWRGHDWKKAATVLARLAGPVPADGKLDAATSRIVVSLAAALTLTNDTTALADLRATYGAAMAATPYAAAFHVIAGDAKSPAGGDPATVAANIAQLGDLQSFMSSFKMKLASAGTSATN